MDKRTIFFIFGMTAIFFLMNQLFFQEKMDVDPSPINQPKTQITITEKGKPVALTPQEKEKFELVKLYQNIDRQGPYFYALHRNEVFLGIAIEETIPEETYFEQKRPGQKTLGMERLNLRITPKKQGDPFLYSKYPLLKLEIPWIPSETTFPISLIYFEDNQAYKINGNGIGLDQITLDAEPTSNALVLFDDVDASKPYAIYNHLTNKLDYFDHLPQFEDYAVARYPVAADITRESKEETYYVLENPYIQLVFSNLNGALAEINLPFQSESHPNSVVKEIGFDRTIAKDYPYNDTFPQNPYYTAGSKEKPLEPHKGGYYPLIRRDILSYGGLTHVDINPHYYALNVFQKDRAPDLVKYTLKRFEKDLIEFELVEGNRRITKTFTLPTNPDDRPYTFDLDLKVEGDARNLFLSLGIPEVELISGSFMPSLKYRYTRNQKSKIEEIKPPKTETKFSHVTADWYSNGNGFFGIILDPLDKNIPGLNVHPVSGEIVPTRLSIIDAQFNRYPADKYPGYAMHTPVLPKPGVTKYRVFAGPFDKNTLETVDLSFVDPMTGGNPEFSEVKSYYGWFAFISKPFAKFLFVIMDFFHIITSSWGISIILLTIVLRLLLYPLNNWSMKSTAKLQKVAPKIKEIQEKYKKDPKRVQLETMNLYRREGANPFGGCLPLLIQLPFMFGMLDLLKSSFQLRGAPFIPGWINDLAAPDVLFNWNYPIPFIGTSFHLLPIFLGVIMYFQQKFVSIASAKAPTTDQQKQQRFMGNMMTIFFTVIFYKFPSGLNIYWISSMSLGILQQWLVNKRIAAKKK